VTVKAGRAEQRALPAFSLRALRTIITKPRAALGTVMRVVRMSIRSYLARSGALLMACACGFADPADGVPGRTPSNDSPSEDAVPAPDSDSLRLTCEFRERVREGEPVPMTLRVENVGSETLDLYLTGRPVAYDLVVTDREGAVVWRRLEGEVVAAVLRIEILEPGAELSFEDVWDQRSNAGEPVRAGEYFVHGELLTEDGPLASAPRPLVIERR
jgi:hypothetical protein